MTIKKWADYEVLYDTNINTNFSTLWRSVGNDHVRTATDRAITYCNGMSEGFGSATGASVPILSSYGYYIVISATSIPTLADFSINNCSLAGISPGKWLLTCSTGTTEVKRAQILKTLFYGTDGSDPRNSSTYIIGLTALQTSDSGDVGLVFQYTQWTTACNDVTSTHRDFTGTFSNTTTNTVSVWSYLQAKGGNSNTVSRVYLPSATMVAEAAAPAANGTTTVDETGTDTSAEEATNPATMLLYAYQVSTDDNKPTNHLFRVLIGFKGGTLTWAETFTGSGFTDSLAITSNNFSGIPALTAYTATDITGYVVYNIPPTAQSVSQNSAIGVPFVSAWEDGASINYKLVGPVFDVYVIISAGSLSTATTLSRDIIISTIGTGKWVVSCSSGSAELKRARIYAWLFYDGNILNFKGITAIETSVSRDVGKRFAKVTAINIQYETGYWTFTPSNTTTNTAVSAWGDCSDSQTGTGGVHNFRVELPTSTVVNDVNNEIGTDTSADEYDNPTSFRFTNFDNYNTANGSAFFGWKGSATIVRSGTPAEGPDDAVLTDYYTTYGVPEMVAVTTTIPSSTEDSGWLDVNAIHSFTTFVSSPAQLLVRLTPKSSSPSPGVPAITGFFLGAL